MKFLALPKQITTPGGQHVLIPINAVAISKRKDEAVRSLLGQHGSMVQTTAFAPDMQNQRNGAKSFASPTSGEMIGKSLVNEANPIGNRHSVTLLIFSRSGNGPIIRGQ